jgi:hypothetical protein
MAEGAPRVLGKEPAGRRAPSGVATDGESKAASVRRDLVALAGIHRRAGDRLCLDRAVCGLQLLVATLGVLYPPMRWLVLSRSGPGRSRTMIDDPRVQQLLDELLDSRATPEPSRRSPRGQLRTRAQRLPVGRLRCTACGCAMISSHTTKGSRRYRHYVCSRAQKRGWKSCPAPSASAGKIERLVNEQIERFSAGDETLAA